MTSSDAETDFKLIIIIIIIIIVDGYNNFSDHGALHLGLALPGIDALGVKLHTLLAP